MNNSDPSHSPQEAKATASSRPGFGCLIKSCLLLLLLAGIAFVANRLYQENVAAEIDPNDTRPVEIISGNGVADGETPSSEISGVTAGINSEAIAAAEHPLLPLLDVAQSAYDQIGETVLDYQATVVSQVQIDGQLEEEKYMVIKIRHEREDGDQKIPFSVYTRFLKPVNTAGQEAIWVAGENDDKIIAHPAGLFNLIRVKLDPEGALAMQGSRYSIRHIGMKNLLKKMLEKGEEGLKNDGCQVRLERNVKVGDVTCTMLEIVYPEQRSDIDFHKARIFIDDQRGLPIAYEGYLWPEEDGKEPPLLEKYIYTNIKLNVGFTDAEFDPDNPEYNYPGGN